MFVTKFVILVKELIRRTFLYHALVCVREHFLF